MGSKLRQYDKCRQHYVPSGRTSVQAYAIRLLTTEDSAPSSLSPAGTTRHLQSRSSCLPPRTELLEHPVGHHERGLVLEALQDADGGHVPQRLRELAERLARLGPPVERLGVPRRQRQRAVTVQPRLQVVTLAHAHAGRRGTRGTGVLSHGRKGRTYTMGYEGSLLKHSNIKTLTVTQGLNSIHYAYIKLHICW